MPVVSELVSAKECQNRGLLTVVIASVYDEGKVGFLGSAGAVPWTSRAISAMRRRVLLYGPNDTA